MLGAFSRSCRQSLSAMACRPSASSRSMLGSRDAVRRKCRTAAMQTWLASGSWNDPPANQIKAVCGSNAENSQRVKQGKVQRCSQIAVNSRKGLAPAPPYPDFDDAWHPQNTSKGRLKRGLNKEMVWYNLLVAPFCGKQNSATRPREGQSHRWRIP